MSLQRTVEFLTVVLSRRGPEQLSYPEDVKWTIRQHLLDLVQEFPALTVRAQEYTHTDGSTVQLLKAEGTLPMYYMRVKYNIPVTIWLPERYPRQAPIMYVVPTPDMIIKPRHTFVDASGTVISPYLKNWSSPRSNLVDLCHDTSIQFGQEPPLFSKPPGWVPPANGSASPTAGPRPQQQQQPPPPPPSSSGPRPVGGPLQQGAKPQTPGPGTSQPGPQPYSPPAFMNPIHRPNNGPFAVPAAAGPFPVVTMAMPSSTPYGNANPFGNPGPPGAPPPRPSASTPPPPPPPSYGQPPASTYGQPSSSPYGQSNATTYGQPSSNPYGQQPSATTYGQPGGGNSIWGGAMMAAAAALGGGQPGGAAGPPGSIVRPSPPPPSPPPLPLQPSPPPPQQPSPQQQGDKTAQHLKGVFRQAAIRALTARLQASVSAANVAAAADIDRLFEQQSSLAQRADKVQSQVSAYQSERAQLESRVLSVSATTAELDRWLAANEAKAAAVEGDVAGDVAVEAADSLSRQALAAQAQDMAQEDCLYALDRALQAGLIPLDAYLKQVRALCRKQFFERALGAKVGERQHELRQAPQRYGLSPRGPPPPPGHPAPPPPARAVQMPQGDSWANSGLLANPLAQRMQ